MRGLNHAEVYALADSFAQLVHALMFAVGHGLTTICDVVCTPQFVVCGVAVAAVLHAAVFCCGCAHGFGVCRAELSAFVPCHPAALASRCQCTVVWFMIRRCFAARALPSHVLGCAEPAVGQATYLSFIVPLQLCTWRFEGSKLCAPAPTQREAGKRAPGVPSCQAGRSVDAKGFCKNYPLPSSHDEPEAQGR